MSFFSKLRWWLTPLGTECRCGHSERFHGPTGGCYYPNDADGADCGCRALRTPFRPESGEQEPTK